MKPEVPPHDLWGNISLEEIKEHLAQSELEDALRLAKLRLAGLKDTLSDIREALATSHEMDPSVWENERRGYREEIDALEEIVAKYGQ